MRFPSLEELAERWTLAHTVAVSAWALVIVLGVALMFRGEPSTYPQTEKMKMYAGENATFTYPANWTINNCVADKPFIELPGTIASDYKEGEKAQLSVYGTGAYNCIKDRPERFDIYPESIVASDTPCAIANSTEGERLENGLYMQLKESDGYVVAVHVTQNSCYAPENTVVLGFAFNDATVNDEDAAYITPLVPKEAFEASPQYRDIRALAESIRY